jgi:hypothetical protein
MKKFLPTLFFIACLLPVASGHGAPAATQPRMTSNHDYLIYRGTILRLDPAIIEVEISGPSCVGRYQFRRSTSPEQKPHTVGNTIHFTLSGECADANTVLTVEPGGRLK